MVLTRKPDREPACRQEWRPHIPARRGSPSAHENAGVRAMSFGLYILGFVILIIGLGIGAHLMHVPPRWIGVGVIVLAGLGILKAVSHTRQRDPSK